MEKKIKTREVVNDIKVHNAAVKKKSVVKSPVKPRPRLKKNVQRKRKPLKIRLMIER